MKTETKFSIIFFAGLLMCIALVCRFTPTKEQADETEFQQRMNDTALINHSEIQVQELSETYLYYRMIEPRYLNND